MPWPRSAAPAAPVGLVRVPNQRFAVARLRLADEQFGQAALLRRTLRAALGLCEHGVSPRLLIAVPANKILMII
jgi:hypothetical protein